MTREYREYAKSRIEYLLKICRLDERDKEALEVAIQALSQESTDVISRDVAITAINKLYEECEEWRALNDLQYGKNQGLSLAIAVIEDLPSVTQKSGKWIPVSERLPRRFRACQHHMGEP